MTLPNLYRMDFLDDPAAFHGSRLIISCATKDVSSNEHINPQILMIKDLFPIYTFTLILLDITLACIISSCACIVLLSEVSSSSHVDFNIARQRRPLASEPSTLPCLTASYHEIYHFLSYALTLASPNLSHMDFLDDPAAIHGSRLIIPCATQDASSNEHINPEISSNNHFKRIYNFTMTLLTFTLACIYLLVPV